MIDEDTTARLVRLGGGRPQVSPERERRVKQAFLDEVRVAARARIGRRRTIAAAAGLAIAAAAVGALQLVINRDVVAPALAVVGTVERLDGEGRRQNGSDAPVRLVPGDPVHVGDRVESGGTGRIGLRLANGASLRFDHGSRARLVSARSIALDAGAVYVDSESDSSVLEIATPFGLVRDVGTQFEVRLDEAALRLRVRSGAVEVRRGSAVSSAPPGTELTVTSTLTSSRPIAAYGEAWAWAASLAPVFDIEGRPLNAFLAHVCREQGWKLVYTDARLAGEASDIVLHGSTAGLAASEALAVVLATTGLTHRADGR